MRGVINPQEKHQPSFRGQLWKRGSRGKRFNRCKNGWFVFALDFYKAIRDFAQCRAKPPRLKELLPKLQTAIIKKGSKLIPFHPPSLPSPPPTSISENARAHLQKPHRVGRRR